MPTLTQLQYIVAVDKEKHFGRAAKSCHVSQPSLSAQVQKVEESLGFMVFDRSKQPIVTTAMGHQVVQQAKVILREHTLLTDMHDRGEELSGTFHLGVIPTLSASVIPLFVQTFSEKYPRVDLKISEYKTEDIVKMLSIDELDGGLLVTPLYDEKLYERTLFYEPFYVFSAAEHPYTQKNQIEEKDLKLEDIWLLKEGHCFRDQVLRLCKADQRQSGVLRNIDFASGSLETIVNLIRRGRGYTLLPHLALNSLTEDERQNQLKPFLKSVPVREVGLVHSRRHLKEGILTALINEIQGHLPAGVTLTKPARAQVIDI